MEKVDKEKAFELLAVYLQNISNDREFIKEVLEVPQTDEDIMELKKLLEQFPDLVPAEVYDFLIKLTAGGFSKEFVKARYLKQEYLREPSKEALSRVLAQLEEDKIYLLSEWELTEDELKIMGTSEVGDTVHIKTNINPALFTGEDEETIYLYGYTSELEIPQKRYKEFTIQQISMNYIYVLIKTFNEAIGKRVVLLLDYDSDEYVEVTDEVMNHESIDGSNA